MADHRFTSSAYSAGHPDTAKYLERRTSNKQAKNGNGVAQIFNTSGEDKQERKRCHGYRWKW